VSIVRLHETEIATTMRCWRRLCTVEHESRQLGAAPLAGGQLTTQRRSDSTSPDVQIRSRRAAQSVMTEVRQASAMRGHPTVSSAHASFSSCCMVLSLIKQVWQIDGVRCD
jgi:hypothetical protein